MSLPSFSIKRPVTMMMVYTILILVGLLALTQLPVELYPNISFGEISIIIQVRGGIPPTEVESLVTKPIEEAVGTVSHLEEMLSISKEGESTVVLSFEPGINMDFAALEVREKFARVKNKLPKEIEKPIIAQFKRSDVPIVIMAVTSPKRSTEEIRKIVDENIKEGLRRVNGVADVEVAGGRERKILVEVDQRKLAAYSISLERVISSIGMNNLNLLSGEIDKENKKYLIRAIGLYKTVDDVKNIPVSTLPDGTLIRLKEVASVVDSYLEPTGYARVNVKPVVSIYMQKESTANTIKVADMILKEIDKIKERLPSDIQIVVTSNQADFIKNAIENLKVSLLKGAGLIMLVLTFFLVKLSRKPLILTGVLLTAVLFLPTKILYAVLICMLAASIIMRKVRPVLIVTSAIPISVIITFSLMWAMKLSVNFMTLFGLALGVGMLVDNSIVVFENVLKKNEAGLRGIPAAIEGAEEVWVAIWASTLTTIIVFLPMVFVGEEIKLLYGGVAWTVTFSLIVSLFVSITVVPLLASRVKFSVKDIPKGYGKEGSVKFLKIFYVLQRKGIIYFIRNRYRILKYAAITFVIALFLFKGLGMEFLGTTEQNKFTIFIEMPTGAKLDVTNDIVRRVEALVKEVPEVKTFSARVEPWSSKVYVELVGLDKRKRSVAEVIESLRPKVEKIKPAFVYFEEEQEVGTKEMVLELFGYDYNTLREIAISMASRLGAVKGFTDTKIRMREGRPELGLKVDRIKTALFDMAVTDVADKVHAQMRGLRATLFHTESSEVETIARIDEKYRKTFKDVHKLILTNKDEDNIYLEQMVDFKYALGPSEIWRKNKSRMIQVSANVGKYPLSKAAEMTKNALADLQFPEGYFYRLGGNYPTMMATQRQFRAIIWLIVVLIYLVLASLFESFYQPFIIMISVPLALIGVVIALYITRKSVGMGVLVGLMMLGGIVVNNAILLIDHTNQLRRKQDMKFLKAVVMASRDRMRPILMTTITTLLGLLPMAISTQEGSNLWSPLAITVMGGLISSTILTLLVVPSSYVVFEDMRIRINEFFTKRQKTS
ncbi:MAG: efflux RND transporter permease subunit [Candidatus Omnitrophica bacterium]|nr:efflux RND transporter permease subunit [Candidatus Omnitrophota bacterium]